MSALSLSLRSYILRRTSKPQALVVEHVDIDSFTLVCEEQVYGVPLQDVQCCILTPPDAAQCRCILYHTNADTTSVDVVVRIISYSRYIRLVTMRPSHLFPLMRPDNLRVESRQRRIDLALLLVEWSL